MILPIVRHPKPAIVFVRRAAHLRRNPGQIAFPGGILDPADGDDLQVAALREFEEELGVSRTRVRIVERLPDVTTLALNAHVTPFLGAIDPPVTWAPDARETAGVYEVPLGALYAPGALHEGVEQGIHEGRRYAVHSWMFDHAGLHVWGATARMLRDLLERYPEVDALPTTR